MAYPEIKGHGRR